MSLQERQAYYEKKRQRDSLVVLTHPSLPGSLYISGYRTKEHFIEDFENDLEELVIYVFNHCVVLDKDEVEVEFREYEYESYD